MKQGVAVLDAIAKKYNHEFVYHEAITGAHAIDAVGDPFRYGCINEEVLSQRFGKPESVGIQQTPDLGWIG